MDEIGRLVREIGTVLRKGGSARAARSSQRFFTDPITSYGWRTPEVDQYALELFRSQRREPRKLAALAAALSKRESNEEFQIAVCLLQRPAADISKHFSLCNRMMEQVDNWSKCDALAIRLLGPAVLQQPKHVATVVLWANSKNRWKRRASAATLVLAARRKQFQAEILNVADRLAEDQDDMVQKGLGWLLRELGKASPRVAIQCLLHLRGRTSRLVLRTACERLPPAIRKKILSA